MTSDATSRTILKPLSAKQDALQSLHGLVGSSARMQRLYAEIRQAASTDINVLILGPTGTGKRKIADAIVAESARRRMPYERQNCAGLDGPLLESGLFGHIKGAFTGAQHDRIGLFEACNDGTLFLDEVAECPLVTQGKLLVALEEDSPGTCKRYFRPLGQNFDSPAKSCNVRIIAATNQDLAEMIRERRFRPELLRRLNGLEIRSPQAHELGEDLLNIARHYLAKLAGQYRRKITGFTSRVEDFILSQRWPDNIGGVENFIYRSLSKTSSEPEDGLLDLPNDETSGIDASVTSGRINDERANHEDERIAATTDAADLLAKAELAQRDPSSSERQSAITAVAQLVCDALLKGEHPLDGMIHGGKSRGTIMDVVIEGIAQGAAQFLETEHGSKALGTFGRDGLLNQIGLPSKKKDIKAFFPKELYECIEKMVKHHQR
jgi:DNA-binding NtrC family response regulator